MPKIAHAAKQRVWTAPGQLLVEARSPAPRSKSTSRCNNNTNLRLRPIRPANINFEAISLTDSSLLYNPIFFLTTTTTTTITTVWPHAHANNRKRCSANSSSSSTHVLRTTRWTEALLFTIQRAEPTDAVSLGSTRVHPIWPSPILALPTTNITKPFATDLTPAPATINLPKVRQHLRLRARTTRRLSPPLSLPTAMPVSPVTVASDAPPSITMAF